MDRKDRDAWQALRWPGWVGALNKELKAAGGAVTWKRAQEALVKRYLQIAPWGSTPNKEVLGLCALASIPDEFLCEQDPYLYAPGTQPAPRVGPWCSSQRKRPAVVDVEGAAVAAAQGKRPRQSPDGVAERAADASGGAVDGGASASNALCIYVANLPLSADEAAVEAYFAECGRIESCTLLRRPTGQSRRIAFVTFHSRSAVDAALGLDGPELGGKPLKVGIATGAKRESTQSVDDEKAQKGKGKTKGKGKGKGKEQRPGEAQERESREFEVFVGGLPYAYSVEQIRKDFGECGEIGRFNVPVDEEGNHTGVAFINYLASEGMQKALEYDDQEYGGVHIRVQRAGADRDAAKGKGKSK